MGHWDIGYPHSGAQRIIPRDFRTIGNRIKAWGLDAEYYDGDRANGYGGFRHDGRWQEMLPGIIQRYGLDSSSAVLEVGCKKGFFLQDLQKALPGIRVQGVENHPYPLEQADPEIRPHLLLAPYEELPFADNEFGFVLAFASVYMLNLGGVIRALREIQRVSGGRSYVTLGSYDTPEERDLFASWTLIGTTVLKQDEWLEVMQAAGYTGDYYFTTAKSLGLALEE